MPTVRGRVVGQFQGELTISVSEGALSPGEMVAIHTGSCTGTVAGYLEGERDYARNELESAKRNVQYLQTQLRQVRAELEAVRASARAVSGLDGLPSGGRVELNQWAQLVGVSVQAEETDAQVRRRIVERVNAPPMFSQRGRVSVPIPTGQTVAAGDMVTLGGVPIGVEAVSSDRSLPVNITIRDRETGREVQQLRDVRFTVGVDHASPAFRAAREAFRARHPGQGSFEMPPEQWDRFRRNFLHEPPSPAQRRKATRERPPLGGGFDHMDATACVYNPPPVRPPRIERD